MTLLLACIAVRELYDLSNAFWRNSFHLTNSLHYYRKKRELQLYQFHCWQSWLRQRKATYLANGNDDDCVDGNNMQRNAGIDFAAIEAGAEAFEIIDNFGIGSNALLLDAERQNFELIHNVDDIQVIKASFYEYSDALPKYYNDQIEQPCEGLSFTLSGKILINCERFSINFMHDNATRDVALHINPRLPQNYIVRNTKVADLWGREEVSSALPFKLCRGDSFSIQVLVTEACYMISVNGYHFAEYAHRIPYAAVRILEVKGDVEEVQLQCHMVQEYPQRLPELQARDIVQRLEQGLDEIDASAEESVSIPRDWCLISTPVKQAEPDSAKSPASDGEQGLVMPYYGSLPSKSLLEGRCLKIEGRVRLLPHSFYINLQQGRHIWPHPLIAFHFNPRFSQSSTGAIGKAVVCRNAWYNGQWAEEERSELDTNLRPGRTFTLVIVCAANAFEVYVNRQFITQFNYHVKPDLVDTVYIQGDVRLWSVTLEKNPMVKGKNYRIYHNPVYSDEY